MVIKLRDIENCFNMNKDSSKNKDIQRLNAAKLNGFIDNCKSVFNSNAPLVQQIKDEVETKTRNTYFFNVISAILAIFGLWVLAGNTNSAKAIALLFILAGIFIGIEFFKRSQALATAKSYYEGEKIGFAVFLLAIPTILSVSVSGYGGYKLAPELRGTPTLVHNSDIDSLNTELAALNNSIAIQEGTTWKGKTTRDATKNLNQLYKDRTALTNKMDGLKAEDKAANKEIEAGFGQETSILGYVLALIGISMDGLLYFFLWKVMQRKHEVNLLYQVEEATGYDIDGDGYIGDPQNQKRSASPLPDRDELQKMINDAVKNNTPIPKRVEVKPFQVRPNDKDFSRNILEGEGSQETSVATEQLPVATPLKEDLQLEVDFIIHAYKNANSNIGAIKSKKITPAAEKKLKEHQDVMQRAEQKLKELGLNPNEYLKRRK